MAANLTQIHYFKHVVLVAWSNLIEVVPFQGIHSLTYMTHTKGFRLFSKKKIKTVRKESLADATVFVRIAISYP